MQNLLGEMEIRNSLEVEACIPRYAEVISQARLLHRQLKIDKPHVSLTDIVDFLNPEYGLTLAPCNPSENFKIGNIDGVVVKGTDHYGDAVYTIVYNSTMPPNRIRFTIAHEIGHLCLGHLDNSEIPKNIQEIEANRFASELLLPTEILKKYIGGKIDIEKISGLFKVSSDVASYAVFNRKEMQKHLFK